MGLMALTREERKICCKVIDFKIFRKMIKDQMGSKFLLKTKKRVEQFEYNDLLSYVENNLGKEKDDMILNIVSSQAAIMLSSSFRSYTTMIKEMEKIGEEYDDQEDELTVEEIYQIYADRFEKYREEYEMQETKLSFDSFVKLNVPTLKQESLAFEKKQLEKQELLDQEKKLKEYDELVEAKNALEEQVKIVKNDLKSTIEANNELAVRLSRYQTIFDKDNYKHKLTGILKVSSLVSLTDNEIYERLNEEEKRAIDKEDYNRAQVVLAAKYFMMTLKGVD